MTTFFILSSKNDAAGCSIQRRLVHLHPSFTESGKTLDGGPILRTTIGEHVVMMGIIETDVVYAEHVDERLKSIVGPIDILLWATKHDSKSGVKTFCVHTQGNFGSADYGGIPFDVAPCPVRFKNLLFRTLVKNNTVGIQAVNEATHHGPQVSTPSAFIEIGSTAVEWEVVEYADVIVKTIVDSIQAYHGETTTGPVPIIVLGGTHVCSNINSLITGGYADLSHCAASYNIDTLTPDVVMQAMARSSIPCNIVVDWKSLHSAQRTLVSDIMTAANIPFERLKVFKERLGASGVRASSADGCDL